MLGNDPTDGARMSAQERHRPNDIEGAPLSPGDLVEIVDIPAWLTHDLPAEDVALLEAERNTAKRILRFDSDGYAWFEDAHGSEWYCLRPVEVRRIPPR